MTIFSLLGNRQVLRYLDIRFYTFTRQQHWLLDATGAQPSMRVLAACLLFLQKRQKRAFGFRPKKLLSLYQLYVWPRNKLRSDQASPITPPRSANSEREALEPPIARAGRISRPGGRTRMSRAFRLKVAAVCACMDF